MAIVDEVRDKLLALLLKLLTVAFSDSRKELRKTALWGGMVEASLSRWLPSQQLPQCRLIDLLIDLLDAFDAHSNH